MEPRQPQQDDGMTRHDLKRFALGAALGLLALPVQAQQSDATHWVSDSITTYVRSVPTYGYRFMGTLTAGEPMTRLESSGNNCRVRNCDGIAVWILTIAQQETPDHARIR